ncbi:hypothetical protein GCM10007867_22310 [Gluconobacter cerinus]|uniref:Transposase n=1 Tax=Gluconobacter cerinus TaxID=38307 RepID=A0AAV5NG28_9PROT|nr:hypothetical protein GCM10007867_22310 [Gluconobacter cerinus]
MKLFGRGQRKYACPALAFDPGTGETQLNRLRIYLLDAQPDIQEIISSDLL